MWHGMGKSPLNQQHLQPLTYPCQDVRELGSRSPVWKYLKSTSSIGLGMGPLARDPELTSLEAYLFAANEPLTLRRLVTLLKVKSSDDVRRLIRRLTQLYDLEQSALQLIEIAGGYQLRTREAYLPWLLKLQPSPGLHLSAAARETLTMIAYRQPINRADLESLRGVSCSEVLRVLLEKGLIRIAGRDKTLGRPVQYGTTRKFLETMGLKSLNELPQLKD